MTIQLKMPDMTELKPRITVFGVGGAGGNAVNNMISAELEGVDFVVANTDAQALALSKSSRIVQMGVAVTEGLGAGSQPEVGRAAAEEAMDEIRDHLNNSHMVFITAGMGGGTGTGAAPVVARAAKEMGILTVGVVTKPFHFEGNRRMRLADAGILELQKHVDTLIVIPNQNLFRVANEKTTFADAFAMADQVLYSGVACITDLMVKEGLINLDFADVRSVMREMGKAMMGTGEASGEKRALRAAEAAIANPLLDETSMRGARGLLISITGGRDMTLYELDEAATRIREEVDQDANIIVGATYDDVLEGVIRVSVVATGIDAPIAAYAPTPNLTVVQKSQEAPQLFKPIIAPAVTAPAMSFAEVIPVKQATPIAPAQSARFAAFGTQTFAASQIVQQQASPQQTQQNQSVASSSNLQATTAQSNNFVSNPNGDMNTVSAQNSSRQFTTTEHKINQPSVHQQQIQQLTASLEQTYAPQNYIQNGIGSFQQVPIQQSVQQTGNQVRIEPTHNLADQTHMPLYTQIQNSYVQQRSSEVQSSVSSYNEPSSVRIEDLPMVAQKQIAASRGEHEEHTEKKMGLMQRLASIGIGRKKDDDAEENEHLKHRALDDNRNQLNQTQQQTANPQNSHNTQTGDIQDTQNSTHIEEDHLDIPAFLRRQAI